MIILSFLVLVGDVFSVMDDDDFCGAFLLLDFLSGILLSGVCVGVLDSIVSESMVCDRFLFCFLSMWVRRLEFMPW